MRYVYFVYPFRVVSEGTWRVPSLLIKRSLPSRLGRHPHTHTPTHLGTYTHISSVRTLAHTHIHIRGQALHEASARPWRRVERRTPEPESEVGPGVLGPRESTLGGSCPGVPEVPPEVPGDPRELLQGSSCPESGEDVPSPGQWEATQGRGRWQGNDSMSASVSAIGVQAASYEQDLRVSSLIVSRDTI